MEHLAQNWSIETAFKRYSDGLKKAVDNIYTVGNAEQAALFRANVSRFAAYKAVKCNQLIEQDDKQPDGKRHGRDRMIATFDRWQQAEEQMVSKRARRAKRFDEIAEKGFKMVKWLPSVSVEKRAIHRPFYNQIYPADSPIWDNQDIWGCKCSMGGTNLPETEHVYQDDAGKEQPLPELRADRGLEGNPAKTGEIFTDKASYIDKATDSYSDKNAIGRDRLLEIAETTNKTVEISFNNQKKEVVINKIGLNETAKKRFGSPGYWLKNEIAEHIERWLPTAKYIKNEAIDLTHNTGKTLKLKKKMKEAHKLEIDLTGRIFEITLFEYKTGRMLFYCVLPK